MSSGRPANGNTPAHAIREAIPTSRHAQMLFDMVLARLGDEAVVETASDETLLSLHRRDGPGAKIVPWSLLRMNSAGRLGMVIPIAAPQGTPDEPPPRPGKAPKLRNLGPGEIAIHDGPHRIGVTYGEDGRWIETTRSRDENAHASVITTLAGGGAQRTELLARYVERLDLGRHGSARVTRPVPVPGGVATVWTCGLSAVRDALFDGRVPPDDTFVVADGFSGSAVASGATEQEALREWRRIVEHTQPRPHIPEDDGEREADSVTRHEVEPGVHVTTAVFTGPTPDVPWPAFVPENTPAVIVPVAPCPHAEHPWGAWVRLLGPHGETAFALARRDLEGCTLIGERLLDVCSPDEIESGIDHADVMGGPAFEPRPGLNSVTVRYRLADPDTHEPIEPRVDGAQMSRAFSTGTLDGVELQWQALRQRWVEA